jgi:putative YhbY family RNA-binding protein
MRSQAHALKPVVIVGADGLTDAVLKEIDVHLHAHQLIKIRVFGDDRTERVAAYDAICDRLSAAPIQHIGKLLVVWRGERAAAPARPTARTSAANGRSTRIPSANDLAQAAEAAASHAGRRVGKPVRGDRAAAPAGAARVKTGAVGAASRTGTTRARTSGAGEAVGAAKTRAGGAPRVVKVVKPSDTIRRPKPTLVKVFGNERVTSGGNVKKAKKRQVSPKRQHQSDK